LENPRQLSIAIGVIATLLFARALPSFKATLAYAAAAQACPGC